MNTYHVLFLKTTYFDLTFILHFSNESLLYVAFYVTYIWLYASDMLILIMRSRLVRGSFTARLCNVSYFILTKDKNILHSHLIWYLSNSYYLFLGLFCTIFWQSYHDILLDRFVFISLYMPNNRANIIPNLLYNIINDTILDYHSDAKFMPKHYLFPSLMSVLMFTRPVYSAWPIYFMHHLFHHGLPLRSRVSRLSELTEQLIHFVCDNE